MFTGPPPLVHFFSGNEGSLDSSKINLLCINFRLHGANKSSGESFVASGMPNLDKRLPFPIVRGRSVITEGMREIDSELSLTALRAQSQIDAIDRTFLRHAG